MQLAISTDSLKGYGLNRIFQIAKEAGFDGIDLHQNKKNYDTLNAEYIEELSKQYDIPVLSVQAVEEGGKQNVIDAIKLAKTVGARIVVVQPPKILDRAYTNWLRKEVPKMRKAENISIALENAPSAGFLGIFPDRALSNITELKRFKHACLDTSRAANKKQDIIKIFTTLQKFLVHIHLSNFKNGRSYLPLDKGDLPLESFLAKVGAAEFVGAISLKLSPKKLEVGNDAALIANLKRNIDFCNKFLKRK